MRWHVFVTYLDHAVPVVFLIEELEELDGMIEGGRDWNLIEKIEVRLIRRSA